MIDDRWADGMGTRDDICIPRPGNDRLQREAKNRDSVVGTGDGVGQRREGEGEIGIGRECGNIGQRTQDSGDGMRVGRLGW